MALDRISFLAADVSSRAFGMRRGIGTARGEAEAGG